MTCTTCNKSTLEALTVAKITIELVKEMNLRRILFAVTVTKDPIINPSQDLSLSLQQSIFLMIRHNIYLGLQLETS